MIRTLILIMFWLCVVACGDTSSTNRTSNPQQIIGSELKLPSTGVTWQYRGKDTLITLTDRHKIIAYFDDSGCSPCRLKELHCWNPLIDEVVARQLPVDFVFIVRADTTNHEVSRSLSVINLRAPLMFDPHGQFEASNLLPRDLSLQYFLLDSQNRVVLMGNPVLNRNLWAQFERRLGCNN